METDLLASLIGDKLEILEQLRELSRRQTEVVGESEITSLLEILAAKQTLIENLQSLEAQLDRFRDQDPDERIWRSPEARERCRLECIRCETLLKEVMLVEKQSEQTLRIRRDACAERLQDLQSGAAAHAAYTDSGVPQQSSLDLSSG